MRGAINNIDELLNAFDDGEEPVEEVDAYVAEWLDKMDSAPLNDEVYPEK